MEAKAISGSWLFPSSKLEKPHRGLMPSYLLRLGTFCPGPLVFQCASVDVYSATHNLIPDLPSIQDLGLVNASLLPPPECAQRGGHPRGPGCHTTPDIALLSLLLFLTSFLFAMALKHVKTSRFFPSMVSVTSLPVGEN